MAVRIVERDEQLTKVIDGSSFFYRRLPTKERADIVQRRQPKRGQGEPNWDVIMVDLLEAGMLGWKDVETPKGENVEWDKDLVQYLPYDIQVELLNCMGANIEKLKEELGN